jgi:hypothetical protein
MSLSSIACDRYFFQIVLHGAVDGQHKTVSVLRVVIILKAVKRCLFLQRSFADNAPLTP